MLPAPEQIPRTKMAVVVLELPVSLGCQRSKTGSSLWGLLQLLEIQMRIVGHLYQMAQSGCQMLAEFLQQVTEHSVQT